MFKKQNIGKKEIFLLYVLLFLCYNILRIKIFGKYNESNRFI